MENAIVEPQDFKTLKRGNEREEDGPGKEETAGVDLTQLLVRGGDGFKGYLKVANASGAE